MIIRVWESPTNEGTECYAVGMGGHYGLKRDNEWTVGRIELVRSGIPERHERYNVYDTEGNLRVVLPAAACAYELDGVVE